jgi:hypothetical protein
MRRTLMLCFVLAGLSTNVAAAACAKGAWNLFVKQLVAAQSDFIRGNPEPVKALWSHAEDVTLMGAWGAHERGWSLVGPRLDWVSKSGRDGTYAYDEVSSIVSPEQALFVQIEHFMSRNADGIAAPVSHLRVTHATPCDAKTRAGASSTGTPTGSWT